jgi:hypothetical protein
LWWRLDGGRVSRLYPEQFDATWVGRIERLGRRWCWSARGKRPWTGFTKTERAAKAAVRRALAAPSQGKEPGR